MSVFEEKEVEEAESLLHQGDAVVVGFVKRRGRRRRKKKRRRKD